MQLFIYVISYHLYFKQYLSIGHEKCKDTSLYNKHIASLLWVIIVSHCCRYCNFLKQFEVLHNKFYIHGISIVYISCIVCQVGYCHILSCGCVVCQHLNGVRYNIEGIGCFIYLKTYNKFWHNHNYTSIFLQIYFENELGIMHLNPMIRHQSDRWRFVQLSACIYLVAVQSSAIFLSFCSAYVFLAYAFEFPCIFPVQLTL